MVAKFVSCMMSAGKKSVAEGIFYRAMDQVEEKTGMSALTVFKTAIANVKPVVEVKSRRVGGANYQVPVEVRPERRLALAIRWLLASTEARPERTLIERLAGELGEAAQGQGGAMRKREEIHKMAESNRAFAHYRW